MNDCCLCKYYKELPDGKRCNSCDEGSRFIPAQKETKNMTLAEITNYLQDWCHHGFADLPVVFEDSFYNKIKIKDVAIFTNREITILKFNSVVEKNDELIEIKGGDE